MKLKFWLPLAAVGLGIAPVAVRGIELTTVPMGGDGNMIHATVTYEAVANRLTAHVEPTVPQLAPLDVLQPTNTFSPTVGWFDCLDPSRQGMAFSRQYGFVIQGDVLPVELGVWIRRISSTPDLEFYRYSASGSWDPMFGTRGSTNVFVWNLKMFHPAIAAPPTNGTHAATFEAYAVDLASGQPYAGIAPAQFTLNWTIVPSGWPRLRLEHDLTLYWPANATNYVLQSAPAPAGPWEPVTEKASVLNDEYTLPVGSPAACKLFRLIRVP